MKSSFNKNWNSLKNLDITSTAYDVVRTGGKIKLIEKGACITCQKKWPMITFTQIAQNKTEYDTWICAENAALDSLLSQLEIST